MAMHSFVGNNNNLEVFKNSLPTILLNTSNSRLPNRTSSQIAQIITSDYTPTSTKMISSILSLDENWKYRVHIIQICLIVLAIVLSIGRVTIRNPPATRANTVAITMVRFLIIGAIEPNT